MVGLLLFGSPIVAARIARAVAWRPKGRCFVAARAVFGRANAKCLSARGLCYKKPMLYILVPKAKCKLIVSTY